MLSALALIGGTIYLNAQLISLGFFSSTLLAGIGSLGILLDLLLIYLIYRFYERKKIRIVLLLIYVLYLAGVYTANFYVLKTAETLVHLTSQSGTYSQVEVITLKDTEIKDLFSLGMTNKESEEGQRAVSHFKEEDYIISSKDYKTVSDMAVALYNKKVTAIVLTSSQKSALEQMEAFEDIEEKTKVIYTFQIKTSSQTTADHVDDITQKPFVVLISGSDSRQGIESTGLSDVNMLAVVNPKIHNILLVSIPRDYYVPFVCQPDSCMDGALDKLTHTGAYGVETTKATIENLLDVNINYTVRIGFEGVKKIVDAVGGIDVYVPKELEVDSFRALKNFSVSEGWNHLNGKQALAFARERYAYIDGDNQRIKNQQQVLQAVFKKLINPNMLIQYPEFLEALQGLFITDISSEQIGELAMYQIQKNPEWTFETYSLYGNGDTDISNNFGGYVYVMKMDEQSVANAREYIDDVLEGIVPNVEAPVQSEEEQDSKVESENNSDQQDNEKKEEEKTNAKKEKEGDLNESKTN